MKAMRYLVLVILPLLALSCTTSGSPEWITDSGSYTIREVRDDRGPAEVDLQYRSTFGATLLVRRQVEEQRVDLGMRLKELPRDRAEEIGVRPFAGMFVSRVERASAAATLGLREGDVLVSVDDQPVIYDSHVENLELALVGRESVRITVWPAADASAAVDYELPVRAETVERTRSQTIPLEDAEAGPVVAGIRYRGIPPEWGERLYGPGRTGIVITGTELGAPAWLAGLRAGDVIVQLDDQPVRDTKSAIRTIRERGLRGDTVVFHVERDEGRKFQAPVDLHEFGGRARASFPLLFRSESSASRDEFRLGPWGLLLDYDSRYLDSRTREPEASTEFSMILGLFKIESSPQWSGVRLLWFLKIGSSGS